MAFATTMWCPVCKQERNIIISNGKPRPVICASCEANKKYVNKYKYLENLKKEDIYKRVEEIESWIYDNKQTDIFKNTPEIY